ncbi:CBS domain-containing protein CBSCBSPB3-like isoform X2 [Primulina huaijiensis]|uniref:CBS domain-containing protein CBSCBSPB3-like isoform X2 n=1 Tax=Primulina huaijiensis TaxID=1492673 RepID=UPI003CC6F999
MSGQEDPPAPKRNTAAQKRHSSAVKPSENGTATDGSHPKSTSPTQATVAGERTVKKLRLSKALTIPEGTTVLDACKRMAARRVDAVLLTDANGLLSGILTDKDIVTKVIAEELRPEQTMVSKVMTRNPIFVNSDTLAIDALQKMVQGKFRHLPVVENGEVIALLDITKCFYDAISRMEKAAEQGSAIAAAVEGVEHQFGCDFSETLKELMFKPSLSTIISENPRVATLSPSDSVYDAAQRMQEFHVNSVLIMTGEKVQGILTSRDILKRVVAQNLSSDLTLVEKVMTQNPECATLETTILEAVRVMHDGKFLHLPVVDKDGGIAACLDVLQITHAAISLANTGSGAANDIANTVMQKFWDSALSLEPPDDYDTHSEMSMSQYMASDGIEQIKPSYTSLGLGNSFSFKFEDQQGHVHRLNSGADNLYELVSAIMQRVGVDESYDHGRPQLLYEDDEGDKVLLTMDGDLVNAVNYARSAGLKVLRLHVDYSNASEGNPSSDAETAQKAGAIALRTGIFAGAIVLTGVCVLVYLKHAKKVTLY